MSESFSSINSYLRCAKLYWYKYVRNLQRKKQEGPLRDGAMAHHMLMEGFLFMQRGEDPLTGVGEGWNSLAEELTNLIPWTDQLETALDNLRDLYRIVVRYFNQADFEGWEVLHVEEEFAIEIDGTMLTFTPDLVLRDPFGKVWIVDHKTTSSMPDGIPFSSQQSLLYYAGVKAHYPETAGFLFNFLRKKLPTEPRLNKTKDKDSGLYFINDLNRIDTEYEMLRDFLQNEAPELLDDPRHRERLAHLRDHPNRFFFMQRVLANDLAAQTIIDETGVVLVDLAVRKEADQWPRTLRDDGGYTSCDRCEFQSICAAELLGLNTEFVLQEYEPREAKNEYESEDA